jgi:hypothetical protein
VLLLSSIPLNVAFRRSLVGANLQAWHNVVAMVASVHQNGVFLVKSM